jgi:hypothetical protein
MFRLGFLAIAILTSSLAHAEIADSAANGFTVKLAFHIEAAPQDVYRGVIHVGDWWDPMHTYSHDARNLSIDDKPMGCFCEKLPHGGGVRHLEVVYADPGRLLVLTGGLGPLQSIATAGSMTIQVGADGGGTKLTVQYTVNGYLAAGMNSWAAPVDSMLTQQFTRLKNFVETGTPENGKAAPK